MSDWRLLNKDTTPRSWLVVPKLRDAHRGGERNIENCVRKVIKENVDLYIHSLIRLHGVVLN
jgi:hypothetical protein